MSYSESEGWTSTKGLGRLQGWRTSFKPEVGEGLILVKTMMVENKGLFRNCIRYRALGEARKYVI